MLSFEVKSSDLVVSVHFSNKKTHYKYFAIFVQKNLKIQKGKIKNKNRLIYMLGTRLLTSYDLR